MSLAVLFRSITEFVSAIYTKVPVLLVMSVLWGTTRLSYEYNVVLRLIFSIKSVPVGNKLLYFNYNSTVYVIY